MKRLPLILSLTYILLSCSDKGLTLNENEAICFSLYTPEITVTKGEVTRPGIINKTDKAYVYGMKSLGSESTAVFEAPGVAQLTYSENNALWITKDSENKVVTWENEGKHYYRFYGYAYNSNAVPGDNLIISNDVYGRQFKVVQPAQKTWDAASADGSGTVDYLLSYLVNVPPAQNYPLVPLHFEHAMAKVEIDIRIANSMFTRDEEDIITGCLVKDIELSVSGIERGATMLCLQPKMDGESGTNTWYVALETDLEPAEYKVTGITTESNAEGINTANPDMSFLAVPVTNVQMSDYALTISYNNVSSEGQKSPADYIYSFDLQDFSPEGWLSAHRIRYVLTIDNSIHLSGSILDFEDMDYIEAPLIPDITN